MQMLIAAMLALSGAADGPCDALQVTPTPAAQAQEAALVARLSGQRIEAGDLGRVLAEGEWRLVWATPQEAERGVFFLRREGAEWHLVEIWGGVITPGERADTIAWARKLPGAPPERLAGCFADALLAGE